MTKSIFIRVTGARFDDSPAVQAACFGVLPAKITIVAVSRYHRPSGQTRTTARILEQGQVPRDLVEELHLTRKDVKAIDEIYLGRGVAEKDVRLTCIVVEHLLTRTISSFPVCVTTLAKSVGHPSRQATKDKDGS